MKPKQKLMIVLGSGGHTNQMIRLTQMLNDSYEFEYVVNDDDQKSVKKIKFSGDIYVIPRPRRIYDNSFIRACLLTIVSIIRSFSIVRNSEAVAVVSAGPGLTVPLFLWAAIFRKQRIFIESWSRVNTRSTSGKLCYYLSDLFLVQWPELIRQYPKSIYAGRLG
jgi:beta-1,4-N-acetylglucosaminyltransferase